MHADTATRQHWMSVLAHSQPAELAARLKALNITADYEVIRAAETGLVQIQARMGGTGERFFAGDATLTRGQTVTFLYRAAGSPAASGGSFDQELNAVCARRKISSTLREPFSLRLRFSESPS